MEAQMRDASAVSDNFDFLVPCSHLCRSEGNKVSADFLKPLLLLKLLNKNPATIIGATHV